jgi:hypothetical protein
VLASGLPPARFSKEGARVRIVGLTPALELQIPHGPAWPDHSLDDGGSVAGISAALDEPVAGADGLNPFVRPAHDRCEVARGRHGHAKVPPRLGVESISQEPPADDDRP